jgi:hypothetical protein
LTIKQQRSNLLQSQSSLGSGARPAPRRKLQVR